MSNSTEGLDWDLILQKGAFVARKVAREYPGVEASDIEQEIYLHFAEFKDSPSIQSTRTASGVEEICLRAARRYAAKERYSFIHYSTEWIYTPEEVRGLFSDAYFDEQFWQVAPQKDDGIKISARNVVVCLWDIDDAFKSLTPADQIAIQRHYKFGLPYEDDAEKKRVYRAIDKVTQRLNGRMAAKSNTSTFDSNDL